MLKENIYYFKHSLKNSDVRLNLSNTLGLLVITRNANEKPNELMNKNQELLDLITTYKTLRSIDKRNNDINKVMSNVAKKVGFLKKIGKVYMYINIHI